MKGFKLDTGKKILALVMVAALLMVLAACTPSTTTITQLTTTTTTATTTFTTTSTPPTSTVTVTVTAPQPPPITVTVTATPTTTPVQLYSNIALGITMKYPQDWQTKENIPGMLVEFVAPLGVSGTSPGYVGLALQDLPINIQSLNDFTTLTLQQLPAMIDNYQLVSSGSTTLAGNPAYVVTYTGNQGQVNSEWLETWTVVNVTASQNKRAYIITYGAEVDKYNDFLATAQVIINSFAISS